MSGFYTRNIFSVMFLTVVSIDPVAIQTEFLDSLHLLGSGSRSAFLGWLGEVVMFAIFLYPIAYYFLFKFLLIPARWVPFLEAVPFFAFGLWVLFIGYLAVLTEFETVTVHLRSGLKMEDEAALWDKAQAKGIPMTTVSGSSGSIAWINAKYAEEGKELCKDYVDAGR